MKVIFRKFKKEGDIIAFLPCIQANKGMMLSYQHIGQHAEADYKGLLSITKLATAEEYASLAKELESVYGEPVEPINGMR